VDRVPDEPVGGSDRIRGLPSRSSRHRRRADVSARATSTPPSTARTPTTRSSRGGGANGPFPRPHHLQPEQEAQLIALAFLDAPYQRGTSLERTFPSRSAKVTRDGLC
jgi:hypothetical protein